MVERSLSMREELQIRQINSLEALLTSRWSVVVGLERSRLGSHFGPHHTTKISLAAPSVPISRTSSLFAISHPPPPARVSRSFSSMAFAFSLDLQFVSRPHFSFRSSAPSPSLLPLRRRRDLFGLDSGRPSPDYLRGSLYVRAGLSPHLPDFEATEGLARELFGRVEGLLYTIADAAVSSSDVVEKSSKQSDDWLTGITNYLETVLKVLKDGLSSLHVPYSYGFAIILLTILVKAATFPLTKKQVESALAMRALQPQIKAIQQRYTGDQLAISLKVLFLHLILEDKSDWQSGGLVGNLILENTCKMGMAYVVIVKRFGYGNWERIQLETARLYKLAGINPLAGCLPTLLTIPVWIGLYRALSNVANEGLLTEGFFWIPSLSGPTTIAARQSGSGISWLFPFVDGHPPLGWSDTFAYLVLPVLLVISQYISSQIMQSSQVNDPSQQNAQAVTKFLPLLIGYFALSVPSGLSLYCPKPYASGSLAHMEAPLGKPDLKVSNLFHMLVGLTNNILSTAQQIWLQKLGGAKNPVQDYINITTRDDSSTRQKTISTAQKTVSDVGADFSNPSQGQQNEITGGLRPGERFKQIKEEEARRRKQREEAKKRALEATEHSDIAIKQISLEATSIETSDEPIENADIQVLKKEKEVHLSVTENGGLNSKTRMSNEDNIGTGNVIKVRFVVACFLSLLYLSTKVLSDLTFDLQASPRQKHVGSNSFDLETASG
ncbi:hypothetical protein ZIOFF_026043 [Zingiber officinale]|uniref:Membrane insertase YidC/Oxa/ALB C-terminal domain-containing protein n=1 Tax=Zingiber officinale TaxID=94328 RepID=A0A8J5LF34_ZINOF|nr:hypothetical protein ZIOFF_026043 [Zingiber officinale]